jgi:outer membrane protein assembly factor BamE (lipoprotein component of BamABCDE complex)
MNAPKTIAVIAASLGLALAAQASFAAENDHVVTQAQIDQIHGGESAAEARQILGAPESTTSWMSGTSSIVYELHTADDQPQLVYVDLDKNNKVTNVEVIER